MYEGLPKARIGKKMNGKKMRPKVKLMSLPKTFDKLCVMISEITMFTKGTKYRKVHQVGFLTILRRTIM